MKKKKTSMTAVFCCVALAVLTFSCSDKKSDNVHRNSDSTQVSRNDTAAIDLHEYAGTYEGVQSTADGPDKKIVLTLQADSTYSWTSDVPGKKESHDEASGVYEVLSDNVFMLIRPSSGKHTFYKVKSSDSLVMTDSLGKELKDKTARLCVLTRKK